MKHINLAPTGTISVPDVGDPQALQRFSDLACGMVERSFLARGAADLAVAEHLTAGPSGPPAAVQVLEGMTMMAISADLVARIEKALPARLAWELAKAIATDPVTDREFIEEVLANLEGAWSAPFMGLPEEAWRPELDRAQNIVLGGFVGRTIVTPLHLVALLNQDLLDSRVWTYPDNGGYDLGYNTLVRRLLDDGEAHGDHNNTLIDRCGATARKHARRARQRLAAAGFYLTPLWSAA